MILQNINNIINKTGETILELNLNRTLGPKYKTWTKHILRNAKDSGNIGKTIRQKSLESTKNQVPSNKELELIRNGKISYKKSLADRRQYIENTKKGLLDLIAKSN